MKNTIKYLVGILTAGMTIALFMIVAPVMTVRADWISDKINGPDGRPLSESWSGTFEPAWDLGVGVGTDVTQAALKNIGTAIIKYGPIDKSKWAYTWLGAQSSIFSSYPAIKSFLTRNGTWNWLVKMRGGIVRGVGKLSVAYNFIDNVWTLLNRPDVPDWVREKLKNDPGYKGFNNVDYGIQQGLYCLDGFISSYGLYIAMTNPYSIPLIGTFTIGKLGLTLVRNLFDNQTFQDMVWQPVKVFVGDKAAKFYEFAKWSAVWLMGDRNYGTDSKYYSNRFNYMDFGGQKFIRSSFPNEAKVLVPNNKGGFDLVNRVYPEIAGPYTGIAVKKPNIYVYSPEKINLSVRFAFPQRITVSDPPYSDKEGWNVDVMPNGTMDDFYRFLFYEAVIPVESMQKTAGWTIKGTDLAGDLTVILDKYHFNAQEKRDFLEYWCDMLDDSMTYRVYPQETDAVDLLMPVQFDPAPEKIYRIWFLFEPVEASSADIPEPTGAIKIDHSGYSIVEWGGMVGK